MSFKRIKGLFIQEFYITIRSYEVILDIFVFPVMAVIVFGFLSLFIGQSSPIDIAASLLIGMLFWQTIFIVQYSVSVGSLWNIWSRNLSNMFVTPLSLTEYLLVQALSGIFKAFCIFVPASLVSIWFFQVNVYDLGLVNLFFFLLNFILFAISLGTIILGLIFRFGTRIQAFAWGLLPIFQPLTAAFYPVSVLPPALQTASYFLPPTYIFEAIRAANTTSGVQWQLIGFSFLINIAYIVFSLWFFNIMFNKSKEIGQFARLEG